MFIINQSIYLSLQCKDSLTKSFALYSRCLFWAYTAFWRDPTLQDSPEWVLELSPPFYKLQHDGGCGKTGGFYGRGPTIALLLLGCEFLHQKQCCVNIMAVHKQSSLISCPRAAGWSVSAVVPYWGLSLGLCSWQLGHSAMVMAKSALVSGFPCDWDQGNLLPSHHRNLVPKPIGGYG